jgi:hypothetical protein
MDKLRAINNRCLELGQDLFRDVVPLAGDAVKQ